MENRFRAALAAIACAILSASTAAQTGIPKSTELNPGRVTPGAGNFIVIGCISREGPNTSSTLLITDSRSKPPAVYRLESGDADLLRFHVGHTVEIGGPITAASPTAAGNAGARVLRVDSLTYISPSCVKLQ